MGAYTKRVPLSFCFVFALASVSRWHYLNTPLFAGLSTPHCTLDSSKTAEGLDTAQAELVGLSGKNQSWTASVAPSPQELQPLPEQTLAAVTQQVDWLNSLVSPTVIPRKHFDAMPRMLQAWVRNCIFSVLVYFGLNFAWAYYIYECFGPNLFPKHNMPSWKDMGEQMWVAFWSLPVYAMLPTLTEEVVERGWTLTYARVSDIGVPLYVALFVLYMCFVEFGVYWMHRGLHDIHSGYRHLHAIHHKYNKENTMSPFAGLAFHPLDGILQAIPYTLTLFIVPTHFLTHELLLFATAFWTTNIHDNLHGNLLPVMGAGWHTIHHTTYRHNYGHYFVIMDWLFGTLISPEELEAQQAARRLGVEKGAPVEGVAPVAQQGAGAAPLQAAAAAGEGVRA